MVAAHAAQAVQAVHAAQAAHHTQHVILQLLARSALDLGCLGAVMAAAFRRWWEQSSTTFVIVTFNVVTFLVCYFLLHLPPTTSLPLGVFAAFGVLRYRAEKMEMREITYLFIAIALALVNAAATERVSVAELLAVDAAIIATVVIFERWWLSDAQALPMRYEDLLLVVPERRAELHADLGARLGRDVLRVDVHRIDLVQGAAEITVFTRR